MSKFETEEEQVENAKRIIKDMDNTKLKLKEDFGKGVDDFYTAVNEVGSHVTRARYELNPWFLRDTIYFLGASGHALHDVYTVDTSRSDLREEKIREAQRQITHLQQSLWKLLNLYVAIGPLLE